MSRRREINNNAQRRFRQRQRDRLQTLEDKLAAMALRNANLETHIQRLGETQVGAAGICKTAHAKKLGAGHWQHARMAGHRDAAGPFTTIHRYPLSESQV